MPLKPSAKFCGSFDSVLISPDALFPAIIILKRTGRRVAYGSLVPRRLFGEQGDSKDNEANWEATSRS